MKVFSTKPIYSYEKEDLVSGDLFSVSIFSFCVVVHSSAIFFLFGRILLFKLHQWVEVGLA